MSSIRDFTAIISLFFSSGIAGSEPLWVPGPAPCSTSASASALWWGPCIQGSPFCVILSRVTWKALEDWGAGLPTTLGKLSCLVTRECTHCVLHFEAGASFLWIHILLVLITGHESTLVLLGLPRWLKNLPATQEHSWLRPEDSLRKGNGKSIPDGIVNPHILKCLLKSQVTW